MKAHHPKTSLLTKSNIPENGPFALAVWELSSESSLRTRVPQIPMQKGKHITKAILVQ